MYSPADVPGRHLRAAPDELQDGLRAPVAEDDRPLLYTQGKDGDGPALVVEPVGVVPECRSSAYRIPV